MINQKTNLEKKKKRLGGGIISFLAMVPFTESQNPAFSINVQEAVRTNIQSEELTAMEK